MLTYAHVCSRMLAYAHVEQVRILSPLHVCSRMLTYADVEQVRIVSPLRGACLVHPLIHVDFHILDAHTLGALLLLYSCFPCALLLLYCCFTVALLLFYCCFTAP
jgi:hypothetical protein